MVMVRVGGDHRQEPSDDIPPAPCATEPAAGASLDQGADLLIVVRRGLPRESCLS